MCVIHSMDLSIVVFFSLIHLSPAGLFCECYRSYCFDLSCNCFSLQRLHELSWLHDTILLASNLSLNSIARQIAGKLWSVTCLLSNLSGNFFELEKKAQSIVGFYFLQQLQPEIVT